MKEILMLLISTLVPALTTLITSRAHNKEFERNTAKMNILQLIMEDRIHVMNNEPIMNYQAILNEFDIYSKDGGNSYVREKVEEYKKLINK